MSSLGPENQKKQDPIDLFAQRFSWDSIRQEAERIPRTSELLDDGQHFWATARRVVEVRFNERNVSLAYKSLSDDDRKRAFCEAAAALIPTQSALLPQHLSLIGDLAQRCGIGLFYHEDQKLHLFEPEGSNLPQKVWEAVIRNFHDLEFEILRGGDEDYAQDWYEPVAYKEMRALAGNAFRNRRDLEDASKVALLRILTAPDLQAKSIGDVLTLSDVRDSVPIITADHSIRRTVPGYLVRWAKEADVPEVLRDHAVLLGQPDLSDHPEVSAAVKDRIRLELKRRTPAKLVNVQLDRIVSLVGVLSWFDPDTGQVPKDTETFITEIQKDVEALVSRSLIASADNDGIVKTGPLSSVVRACGVIVSSEFAQSGVFREAVIRFTVRNLKQHGSYFDTGLLLRRAQAILTATPTDQVSPFSSKALEAAIDNAVRIRARVAILYSRQSREDELFDIGMTLAADSEAPGSRVTQILAQVSGQSPYVLEQAKAELNRGVRYYTSGANIAKRFHDTLEKLGPFHTRTHKATSELFDGCLHGRNHYDAGSQAMSTLCALTGAWRSLEIPHITADLDFIRERGSSFGSAARSIYWGEGTREHKTAELAHLFSALTLVDCFPELSARRLLIAAAKLRHQISRS
jgi:hypothetical protein